uniref:Uncharacterized protein n=1 Tax=Glossina austeni TaxID=7395 RepID=A0A1A9UYC7_GLOAU
MKLKIANGNVIHGFTFDHDRISLLTTLVGKFKNSQTQGAVVFSRSNTACLIAVSITATATLEAALGPPKRQNPEQLCCVWLAGIAGSIHGPCALKSVGEKSDGKCRVPTTHKYYRAKYVDHDYQHAQYMTSTKFLTLGYDASGNIMVIVDTVNSESSIKRNIRRAMVHTPTIKPGLSESTGIKKPKHTPSSSGALHAVADVDAIKVPYERIFLFLSRGGSCVTAFPVLFECFQFFYYLVVPLPGATRTFCRRITS